MSDDLAREVDAPARGQGREAKPPLIISTSTLPVRAGDGVARFVLDLASSLTGSYQVSVLAPHSAGAPIRERIGQVEIVRFRYFFPARFQRLSRGGVVADNLRSSWWARVQTPFLLLAQLVALNRLIRRTGAGVVNSHWLVPQGLTAALVSRQRSSVSHVLHVHAADVYLLQRLPLGASIARFVANRSDAILADGSHVRAALDDLLGRPSGAALRPMGVWIDQFTPKAGSPGPKVERRYVLFVGRFVEKKGIPYLLEAMSVVRDEHPDLGLVLIGDGPLRKQLESQVEALGLKEAVTFVGALAHDEVVRYLHGCQVACVPSVVDSRGETEGMPTVVIEAMAAGARVVGTAVDGIPDVLRHAENGWLCRPADSDDLAKQLLAALDDPIGKGIVTAGEATARQNDWLRVADQYARVIRQVDD